MPMELTNTPATFMQTTNNLFSNILDSSIAVFLKDILMFFMNSEGPIHINQESTGMITSVYILL